MRSAQLALTALALVAANAAIAADRNLLPNGDFSQQNKLMGWNCFNNSWSTDDASSDVSSGSMELHDGASNAGYCTSPCIAVRPGAAYSLGGQSRAVFGQLDINFACAEDSSAQCRSFTYNLQGPAMSTANAWNSPPAIASGILGSGTRSLFCTITGRIIGSSYSVHIDNLFFTTDAIFANDFEGP